ncbi:hypothetical protein K501DRAFT_287819 [Backusella circina FSU 941]|nr:hypothetical protein K501DRAFT_287819 [Backusella circina FSU 941]
MEISKEEEQEQDDQQQRSYLEQLQKEAFDELRLQLQHYNDEFITRMRYIEQTRDYLYKEQDDDMQELQACFNAASVKDYSQLIESYRGDTHTSPNMF